MSSPPRNASAPRRRAEGASIRLHPIAGARVGAAVVALLATVACGRDSQSPSATAKCSTGKATTAAVGAVTSPLTGTALCVSGGSGGAEYALIPFNPSTESTKVSFDVTATGVGTVGSAVFSILPGASGSARTAQLSVSPSAGGDPAFEARLRAREAALESLIPGARRHAALRNQRSAASRAVIPATITLNQLLELNTNSATACEFATYRFGRVVAVSNKSIVVADTLNPVGGFTDADYQSIAETFDNVVDPVLTANFGAPTDIDGNGRVLLFFTRSVNELTPAQSEGRYVGGFFFARDLFPPTSSIPGGACASSNYGELFYLLVPDPTGLINGNEFSTADVREIAVSIVGHEYQHLINASRRMYVSTTAEDFEEVWLNEGLSHIAEELIFYAEAKLQPRRDLDSTGVRSASATSRVAFNSHAVSNFSRFRQFLLNPTENSPYADNDSLATRGATWSFLRFAVDQENTTDRNLWFQLVNSGKTGMSNLRDVFGPDLTGVLRDWSTSAFADNLAGVQLRYQQPSWHFRSVYTALYRAPYPLATVSRADGEPRTVELVGGGSAYLRFAVPAGGAGEVTWTAPSTMQMTLLRTR